MSADSDFTPKGITTGIEWSKITDKLKLLAEDLEGYPEGRKTLKLWNDFVFADAYHTDEENDDDDEDEFEALKKDVRSQFDGKCFLALNWPSAC